MTTMVAVRAINPTNDPRYLAGTELRYLLTTLLIEAEQPVSLADLVRWIGVDGFILPGRPSKTVSDALRWEIGHGRVVRCGRALYSAGSMPRQTKSRIRHRVAQVRGRGVAVRRDVAV